MRRPVISRRTLLASGLGLVATPVLAAGSTTTIMAPGGRVVCVSTWAASGKERGVILFSHGALSSPEKYERLLGPWSQLGFRILAPLHTDSTDHPDHDLHMKAMDGWRCRIEDMRALSASIGGRRYVAAGHSWGALDALTLGGAEGVLPTGVSGPFRDSRAICVVAFSPPGPSPTLITREGYARLAVPAFIETGTGDSPPAMMGGGDYHTHLASFDAASGPDKYAVVLDGADHYFGNLICRPELSGPPQTEAFNRAVALSADFVLAYGLRDTVARTRLERETGAHPGFTLTAKSA